MILSSQINYGITVSGSSALPAGVNTTNFYARWVGYLVPSITGVYTIGVNSDDGANLIVGGQPVVSNLATAQGANSTLAYTQSGTINLTAGVYYEIVLEWQQGGGGYECQLIWTPPGGSIQLVPSATLSTSSTSITGNLAGDFWNGTSLMWFPTGTGVTPYGFTGAWSSIVGYIAGDEVTYQGSFWKSLTTNINSAPTLTNTDWQNVGSTVVGIAPYNGSAAYYVNNQVTYNGNVYQCISPTTGNLPTNATFWTLIGPASLDNVADSPTYIRQPTYTAAEGLIDNGNFQNGLTGWAGVSATIDIESSNPPYAGGGNYIHVANATQFGAAAYNRKFAVNPGEVYKVGGYHYSSSTGDVADIQLLFIRADGSYLGGVQTGQTVTGGWQYLSAQGTAPAGTAYATFQLQNQNASAGNVYFAMVNAWRVRSLNDEVSDGSQRFAATASTLTYRPLTNPLTATDAGSNATVSIAAFTMRTSSKGDISVNSGSITVLSYGALYYIYYDDPALAGGAVTYHATTTKETAIQGIGRFFVGSIVTPLSGGGATNGNNDGGTGAQFGQFFKVFFSQTAVSAGTTTVGGIIYSGGVANPTHAIDGDDTTFAGIATDTRANGRGTFGELTVSIPPCSVNLYQTAYLKIKSSSPTNTGNPANGSATGITLQYILPNGTATTVRSTTNGQTYSPVVDSIQLPTGINLAAIQVQGTANNLGGTQGLQGWCQLNLYEAWLEITS